MAHMMERRALDAQQVRELANTAALGDRERPGDYMLNRLNPEAFHLADVEEITPDGYVRAKLHLRLRGGRSAVTAFLSVGSEWEQLPTTNDRRRQLEEELANA